jgi:hypothetical protein
MHKGDLSCPLGTVSAFRLYILSQLRAHTYWAWLASQDDEGVNSDDYVSYESGQEEQDDDEDYEDEEEDDEEEGSEEEGQTLDKVWRGHFMVPIVMLRLRHGMQFTHFCTVLRMELIVRSSRFRRPSSPRPP